MENNQLAVWENKLTAIKNGVGRRATYIKWGLGVALLAILAPVIVSGLLGALAAVALGVLGLCAVNGFPYLAQRLANAKAEALMAEANRHIAAIKAEATKNPIETMMVEYRNFGDKLKQDKERIAKFSSKVIDYASKVVELKKKFPNDAKQFEAVQSAMQQLLERRKQKWLDASQKHELFYTEIERAQAVWEMSKGAAELREYAGDLEQDFMSKLKTDTAFESVRLSLSESLADLDMLMMEKVPLTSIAKNSIEDVRAQSMLLEPGGLATGGIYEGATRLVGEQTSEQTRDHVVAVAHDTNGKASRPLHMSINLAASYGGDKQ